ncbi:MAG: serine hydrolase, partial [Deltaproteobacteria bacterium]|nr:serine hydrolase [Deltaproteobacteria bacterium]
MAELRGTCARGFERVRDAFGACFGQHAEVGAAVCVYLDGEPVVDLWGGYADREQRTPWQRDTLALVFSATKGVTAACVHRLSEQGKLDLDAPVASYWPEFAAAGKESITVRQLISHQAGLPAVRKTLAPADIFDWDLMVQALAEEEPWWKPGSQHGYHPVTYGFLVGEVIRRVAGRSVGQMFREDVAEPLEADFHIGLDAAHDERVSNLIGGIAPP